MLTNHRILLAHFDDGTVSGWCYLCNLEFKAFHNTHQHRDETRAQAESYVRARIAGHPCVAKKEWEQQ